MIMLGLLPLGGSNGEQDTAHNLGDHSQKGWDYNEVGEAGKDYHQDLHMQSVT